MVTQSFTLSGDSIPRKQPKSRMNDIATPLRRMNVRKTSFIKNSTILFGVLLSALYLAYFVYNYVMLMPLANENFQIRRNIEAAREGTEKLRAELNRQMSYDVITKKAQTLLKMQLSNTSVVEIPVVEKGGYTNEP
ncbi:MAG: hypothetical protein AAB071_01455 [Bacteroidota bacterium]